MKGRGKKGSKVKRTAGEIRQPIRERGHGPNLFPEWDVFSRLFALLMIPLLAVLKFRTGIAKTLLGAPEPSPNL